MKLWGGRFSGRTQLNEAADRFNSSLVFDKRLYKQDITGSIAHAEMLKKQNIISDTEADKITESLKEILTDIESGVLVIDIDNNAEDIHSFVEAELVSRIGDAGKRLHTGRSRNDQIALDMRMYVKSDIDYINSLIIDLLEILLSSAKRHTKTIMPGFTHLQKAQPVTLAHYIMAYAEMFKRDLGRLRGCRKRTDEMPLGSGALASTVYPLDRDFVREKLGFAKITANSLDAVSDRDFCVEFLSCLSVVMMHLSRFCEELILWSSQEFAFIEISDAYSTGSSIMPQKKNPDMAELIRGKTGRVYGDLTGILTVMKSLPLAYNKDMQEDKEFVFDASDTVKDCLVIFAGMFESIKFNTGNLYKSALGGYTNATDAADWLVNKKGVPFREAHEITGRLVLYAIEKNSALNDLTISEFKSVSDVFDETVFGAISVEAGVNSRDLPGGPAEAAVLSAIEETEKFLKDLRQDFLESER
ncbi:MAG: argininosuccinate lyase [Oscillospiraceae bacterium]|nr:argininosuccinate lyase [Oscillospiraceae bacterium]